MASSPDGSPVTPTPRQRLSGVDRPFALHPPAIAPGAGSSHHYRFAEFDEGTFSERAGVSAEQAKRALRAHLAETERRMAEAGRLGTNLVQQQKELTEKLREVEELQAESELSPELKRKLAELEKEYDDVAKETARAFLPKQRIPSNESTGSPEGKGGRRSLSPVKYESHASGSPSKMTVSNRKQRNQAANRVHDIEFAAEISTSLISQVRGLQSLLAEREEELRDTKQDLARLEDTSENLRDRIKELDESEHRYKEENWNLETRIHDLEAAQRDASDNEKKVAQQLAALLADKNKAQRELDELKAAHARLVDDHTASVKLHDIELGTAKRNMAMADGEKASLQRKVDELASQNQELARAVSMQHRVRAVESDALPATSDDEFATAADDITPEHSPPASPVKGTPRHSVLESETLKTSLLHAQRTLQSLRTNLHREKTEKLELRRMLQDARDELERVRSDPNAAGAGASKRTRKDARESHNKLRSSQLGGARSSRTDLFMLASADADWEEVHGEPSPSTARARAGPTETSDQFETANEAQLSDTSFATANDGAETTEDFHTGAEELSSGEDTMTETEQDTRRRRALGKGTASTTAAASHAADADADPANQSTASTSDDDEFNSPRTPTATLSTPSGGSRMRLRVSRSSLASRRLRHMSSVEETGSSPAGLQSSPFSGTGSPATIGLLPGSSNSTPRAPGQQQSLFAELGELDEDSDDDVASNGTLSRRRSPGLLVTSGFGGSASSGGSSATHSPLSQIVSSHKVVMVDRATITDAVTILPWSEEEELAQQGQKHGQFQESRPSSFLSDGLAAQSDLDMDEKLKEFPSPPTSPPRNGLGLTPIVLPPPEPTRVIPEFTISDVFAVPVEPLAEPESPAYAAPEFTVSGVHSVPIEPLAEPEPPAPIAPEFTVSSVLSVPIEPLAEPEPPAPVPPSPVALAVSSFSVEHVTPKLPPTPEPIPPPVFSTSSLHAIGIAPIELPPPVVPVPVALPKEIPTFSLSAVQQQHVEPIPEPAAAEIVPPAVEPFTFSDIQKQHVEPIAEPEPIVEPFSMSGIQIQHVEPIAVPEPDQPAPLPAEPFSVSAFHVQHVVPISESAPDPVPEVIPESLSYSDFQTQHVEPVSESLPLPPQFSMSTVHGEHVAPVATPMTPAPSMGVSDLFSQQLHPIVAEDVREEPVPAAGGISTATQTDEWTPGTLAAVSNEPRSPKRNAFIIPRDSDDINVQNENASFRERPATPNRSAYNALLGSSKLGSPPTPIIAEDETRQSPNTSPLAETPESQRPFKEISVNTIAPRRGQNTDDDQIFAPATTSPQSVIRDDAFDVTPRANSRVSKGMTATPGRHSRTTSQESINSSIRRGRNAENARGISTDFSVPPLPANHREVIEAARTGSAGSLGGDIGSAGILGTAGAGPSNWRVQTPPSSAREANFANRAGTPTPKANNRATISTSDMPPPSRPTSRTNASTHGASAVAGHPGTISRQTSISSFASEVDARFNIHDATDVFGNGQGGHSDPRMIQAITQTMIGEYLWKYTRKAGRSGLSENRHRRYFWIHPYTRMLYWSDQGPTPGSRAEQRAKSVVIEGVRVVTDDNPMPPGLHRKSLVVISPGRTIKFTCPTSHRHEIWFNALSYLLLRNEETAEEDPVMANGDRITREDVEEFNPSFGRRPAASTQARRRPPVSLSSYNSRTTRNESPAFDVSMNVPTLTPTPKKSMLGSASAAGTPSASVAGLTSRSRLSRIGGYWRSSQSLSAQFNSLRGRSSTPGHRHTNSGAQSSSIYEASEVNDSAEELRRLYEAQDRASDRLENVRACCDGKHDVGTLSHSSRRHRHSHGASSALSTPTHSTRHRS